MSVEDLGDAFVARKSDLTVRRTHKTESFDGQVAYFAFVLIPNALLLFLVLAADYVVHTDLLVFRLSLAG
jgi:hypothetical protein